MLSSFHSARALSLALGGALAATAAPAAETYVQPFLDMGATHHTNRGLHFEETANDEDRDATGLEVDGAVVFGIVTPASRTLFRPNARYETYFSKDNLDNVDYGLDLSHRYLSPRHEFEFIGRAQRREGLSTQYIEPGFDDFDPNDPTVNDPGLLEVDDTITRVQLRPSYGYRLSQRTTIGIDAVAQTFRFGEQGNLTRVDYDYGRAGLSWEFLATERTTVFLNPFVARYETKNESYTSDSEGVEFGFEHNLSETFTFGLTAAVENDHVERTPFIDTPAGPIALPLVEEDTTNWSAVANVTREGELSNLRLAVGRLISPSTRGAKVTVDQANLQWRRLLSPRLEFVTAARYMREERIDALDQDGRRDTAGVEVGLRWRMTERWHVQGRAEWLRREFEFVPEAANDESLFIGIGYAGLGSQTQSTD